MDTQKLNLSGRVKKIAVGLAIAICGVGIFFRLYRITQNDFFFFDEGLYLGLYHKYLTLLANLSLRQGDSLFGSVYLCLRLALGEGKPLWFFISHLRVIGGEVGDYYYLRVVSSMAGIVTIGMVYLLARRLLNSRFIAALSAAIFAILPSHIFYSRLALSETFSSLLFLIAFYLYLSASRLNVRFMFSVFFFVLSLLSNYRFIVFPVLILFSEVFLKIADGKELNIRKWFWHTVLTIGLFICVGSLDDGQNIRATFGWIFYQIQQSRRDFDLWNFLSYPYDIVHFEGVLFGPLFLGNVYFLFTRQRNRSFCFLLVLLYMMIFSFSADRSARYLCVMLPFLTIAVANLLEFLFNKIKGSAGRVAFLIGLCIFAGTLLSESFDVIKFRSDYRPSIAYLKRIDKTPIIISTQRHIHGLFMPENYVHKCPYDFLSFLRAYRSGVKYLILDPQAYVSWTRNGKKFSLHLRSYLNFIKDHVRPIKTFPHFKGKMLERFVFEHNENLRQSLEFLNSEDATLGELKIYDMKTCMDSLSRYMDVRNFIKGKRKESDSNSADEPLEDGGQ